MAECLKTDLDKRKLFCERSWIHSSVIWLKTFLKEETEGKIDQNFHFWAQIQKNLAIQKELSQQDISIFNVIYCFQFSTIFKLRNS